MLFEDIVEEYMHRRFTKKALQNKKQEYKQIKKLVQTIISNKDMDSELLTVLPEIYCYGLKGEVAHSFIDHIEEYESKIKQWLKTINRTKLNIS